MAVSRAAARGRLPTSVVRDATGRAVGISDPDLADREWAANTDYTDAPQRAPAVAPKPTPAAQPEPDEPPAGPGEVDLSRAAALAKHWDAQLKELKFREAAKELIPARDVEQKLVDVFSACKVRLLEIPTRAKQALPHLSITDLEALETIVRDALEELAR
jgi:hypothetical protein